MPPEQQPAREHLAKVADGLVDAIAELARGDMKKASVMVLLAPAKAKAEALAIDCREGRLPWERVLSALEVLRPLAQEVIAACAAVADRQ